MRRHRQAGRAWRARGRGCAQGLQAAGAAQRRAHAHGDGGSLRAPAAGGEREDLGHMPILAQEGRGQSLPDLRLHRVNPHQEGHQLLCQGAEVVLQALEVGVRGCGDIGPAWRGASLAHLVERPRSKACVGTWTTCMESVGRLTEALGQPCLKEFLDGLGALVEGRLHVLAHGLAEHRPQGLGWTAMEHGGEVQRLRGHLGRQLLELLVHGVHAPTEGASLLAPELQDAQDVGRLLSGSFVDLLAERIHFLPELGLHGDHDAGDLLDALPEVARDTHHVRGLRLELRDPLLLHLEFVLQLLHACVAALLHARDLVAQGEGQGLDVHARVLVLVALRDSGWNQTGAQGVVEVRHVLAACDALMGLLALEPCDDELLPLNLQLHLGQGVPALLALGFQKSL
mmetsp:Transcript_24418/g.70629  ORF Transcript_24418/g.70629 Transcript_24418/m.70629 type:complete len:399 (-) Transcript_24418:258-1454(-)